jgi:small subunit ribosomal protein S7
LEVRPDRKIAVGMKWMINYARKRNEKSMAQKLAGEIVAASKEEGAALKRKKTFTKWQKPTKHSLTLVSNR